MLALSPNLNKLAAIKYPRLQSPDFYFIRDFSMDWGWEGWSLDDSSTFTYCKGFKF